MTPYPGKVHSSAFTTVNAAPEAMPVSLVPPYPGHLPPHLAPYYPSPNQTYLYTPPQSMGVMNMPRREDYPATTEK